MITLKAVDGSNFNECTDLNRESTWFVGSAESVLAKAYLYREDSTAYAIYNDNTIIGLVIIRDRPCAQYPYSFTELFIADEYLNKGYGKQAVAAILDKFRSEKKCPYAELQVHHANEKAIGIYKHHGFAEDEKATGEEDFIVMRVEL